MHPGAPVNGGWEFVGQKKGLHPLFCLDDVLADVEGLNHGAGFVLYVRNGVMDLLEGYCYDEPWPPVVGAFALNYHRLPRALRLSRDGGQRTTQVIVSVPD